jgi:hypothetical protein
MCCDDPAPRVLSARGPFAEAIELKLRGRLKQGALSPAGGVVTEALMGPTDAARKINTVPACGGTPLTQHA